LFTELMQFAAMLLVFAGVFAVWLYVVYLPGRTLERWEDQWSERRERDKPGERGGV
jgi:hypothetical protein